MDQEWTWTGSGPELDKRESRENLGKPSKKTNQKVKKILTLGRGGGGVKSDQILTFSKLCLKCISSHSKSF